MVRKQIVSSEYLQHMVWLKKEKKLLNAMYQDICFEIKFEQCRDLSACVYCNNAIGDDRPLS